ncbi:spore germination protein PA [Thalassobacillus cyri]|uniref:Spore germination protein PA n=1 Tax=Thalassobacillus cyri TaxID=571932 RepID=A0A1H4GKC2_9BACI|nr:spore germination protein [Thalassobacillus cyri]SEB10055.1 spore germination protein PA [Thalassobacillus cyri]
MPAQVGAVKVISISSSSIFNIGDVFTIAPTSSAKTFAGGGSFNSGDGIRIDLGRSVTYVNDRDVTDQSK